MYSLKLYLLFNDLHLMLVKLLLFDYAVGWYSLNPIGRPTVDWRTKLFGSNLIGTGVSCTLSNTNSDKICVNPTLTPNIPNRSPETRILVVQLILTHKFN